MGNQIGAEALRAWIIDLLPEVEWVNFHDGDLHGVRAPLSPGGPTITITTIPHHENLFIVETTFGPSAQPSAFVPIDHLVTAVQFTLKAVTRDVAVMLWEREYDLGALAAITASWARATVGEALDEARKEGEDDLRSMTSEGNDSYEEVRWTLNMLRGVERVSETLGLPTTMVGMCTANPSR